MTRSSVKLSVIGRLAIFSNLVLNVGSWQYPTGKPIYFLPTALFLLPTDQYLKYSSSSTRYVIGDLGIQYFPKLIF